VAADRKSIPNRERLIELLNRRLADGVDLQTQCKQAHWNVKGPGFIGLHKLFDEVFDAAVEYADLIAERIVQLGGVARGTAREAAAHSELAEFPMKLATGLEAAQRLSAALSAFADKVRAAIDESDDLGDKVTADICTEVARETDKWRWMVESHVKETAPHAQANDTAKPGGNRAEARTRASTH
jgi:starvation-inducible DNA-binding protein